jgi:hypothetical protein
MQPVTTPAPGGPAVPGMPAGAQRKSRTYYDLSGVLRRAADEVPVTQDGTIAGTQYRCRQHGVAGWFPTSLKTPPACTACGKRMVAMDVQRPALLPWRALWGAAERPLRPVWAIAAGAAAGYAVDAAAVPALVLAGAAPLAGFVAAKAATAVRVKVALKHGRLEHEDPDGDKRLRAAIGRAARSVGYTTFGATLALAAAAGLGVDVSTWPGRVAAAVMFAAWLVPAASWWRRERLARLRPEPVVLLPVSDEPEPAPDLIDPGERDVRRIWDTILAVRAGQVVGVGADGSPVKATANGKLAGTHLEDWHRVTGGWGATIVGPIGAYESEQFAAAVGKIASAYSMKKSMITVIPDPDDENQSFLLAQRNPPIKETIRWSGPESIDVDNGVAPVAMYADGTPVMYELYRPGWGVPHVAAFGTTGSGKSEFLNQLFTIDRWAHYIDEHGQAHGIVANFLVDPQQGQSFAPFLDDLAAPVATSLDEAIVLVEALTAEMLRRNRYLARVEYRDERGRRRKGRKWWNPLIDGPILSLTIDEAHDYLGDRRFSTLVTKAGRMWRKCGGQLRIATHTPLLTDLGGSMALRDMLTGGFVWVGRTANSLSGPTAFNGRLPADPRTIPMIPGMAYILTGLQPKAMLARTEWEPDYYDWVRDDSDEPIGYPAVLPAITLETFGEAYAQWVKQTTAGELWVPDQRPAEPVAPQRSVDAVLLVLFRNRVVHARGPMSMDELDEALKRHSLSYSTRTVREALKTLRGRGLVASDGGRHAVTDEGAEAALVLAETESASG